MKQFTTTNNKHGVSIVELLGYIVLMGSIFSLLATTTLVIAKGATRTQEKNKLTLASTQLYSDILSSLNYFQPDNAEVVAADAAAGKPKTLVFTKQYKYDDDGDRVDVASGEQNKYVYTFVTNNVNVVRYVVGSTTGDSKNMTLDNNVTLTEFDFNTYATSTSVINVEFKGKMTLNNSKHDFVFTVPIYKVV